MTQDQYPYGPDLDQDYLNYDLTSEPRTLLESDIVEPTDAEHASAENATSERKDVTTDDIPETLPQIGA